MDKLYLGYKNNFKYEQEKRAKTKHKKSSSMTISTSYNNNHKNFSTNYKNYNENSSRDTLEDYQRLAKKFYCIIMSLQDELTRQTIKNYSLLEENINLKEQISEIQKNKNIN